MVVIPGRSLPTLSVEMGSAFSAMTLLIPICELPGAHEATDIALGVSIGKFTFTGISALHIKVALAIVPAFAFNYIFASLSSPHFPWILRFHRRTLVIIIILRSARPWRIQVLEVVAGPLILFPGAARGIAIATGLPLVDVVSPVSLQLLVASGVWLP